MTYFNVDALQESEKMRGSEWIKIGVDTGAGMTAWPQSITYGTTIPGDSDLTFRTATGELVKGEHRCANHCCLLETTQRWVESLCCMKNKGYMFHKGSNVAKKIDAWIQKELRDSQHRGCTVAYKENNVYNIYMKPKGNKIDAMPLSGDSESGSCRLGPNLYDRRIQIQKFEEEHMIQCEMLWKVTGQRYRGCQIYLLNPVQDRSLNTS